MTKRGDVFAISTIYFTAYFILKTAFWQLPSLATILQPTSSNRSRTGLNTTPAYQDFRLKDARLA